MNASAKASTNKPQSQKFFCMGAYMIVCEHDSVVKDSTRPTFACLYVAKQVSSIWYPFLSTASYWRYFASLLAGPGCRDPNESKVYT